MKISLLIFDFDGTIVDSKQFFYKIIERYAPIYGFDLEFIERKIKEGKTLNETLKEMGLSYFSRIAAKLNIFFRLIKMTKEIKKCKDVDKIKKLKVKKIVVSNSPSFYINKILKNLKIKKYFNEVYGSELFKNKEKFIKEYLKKNKIKNKEVLYVGDRVVDVLLAKKVGCYSVIVVGKGSWDSKKEILKAEPDFIIDDLGELEDILNS